jgi:hypothetical protein
VGQVAVGVREVPIVPECGAIALNGLWNVALSLCTEARLLCAVLKHSDSGTRPFFLRALARLQ